MDTTVLIHGETGVGELLARSIHFGLPPGQSLRGRELRGHSRRAVRIGAVRLSQGRVHQRHRDAAGFLPDGQRGTLLLDEIGEMPLPLQSKLLRAIEERRVTPIGSDRSVEIDVRFIATTNKDLQAEVERGAFRRDLFYRLSVMPIRVPPLRERPGDIPLLAQHFLEASARRAQEAGAGHRAGGHAGAEPLRWPGNVRELENVIERA